MRAMVLLMVVAGCGGKAVNTFELDIAVNAPAAADARVDGTVHIPPAGGIYARGFPTLNAASKISGTLETLNADGSVRAHADYGYGSFCAAVTPLERQTERFVETDDGMGNLGLALDMVECLRTDGTGTVVTP